MTRDSAGVLHDNVGGSPQRNQESFCTSLMCTLFGHANIPTDMHTHTQYVCVCMRLYMCVFLRVCACVFVCLFACVLVYLLVSVCLRSFNGFYFPVPLSLSLSHPVSLSLSLFLSLFESRRESA